MFETYSMYETDGSRLYFLCFGLLILRVAQINLVNMSTLDRLNEK